MKRFWQDLIRRLNLPNKEEVKKSLKSLSKREYAVFIVSFLVLLTSTVIIISKINKNFIVEIPTWGGEIREGVIGTPRFINPLLQFSDTDKDLTALVYSGLMRREPNGSLTADLAESYEISKDNLSYTVTLKENIFFHDKEPVTADDVIFTIERVKDNLIKSPKKINWDGVTVLKLDERRVEFNLKQPYASFLDNLTLGIMPYHVWKDISRDQWNFSNLNIEAVGSGPYKISEIKKKSGIPRSYELTAFKNYVDGKPFVRKITFKFYDNEDGLVKALLADKVDQISSISPENALRLESAGYHVETAVLPRIFGLFFNQNQAPLFTDKAVIKAIGEAINKERIIEEVLRGYGISVDSPLPSSLIEYASFKASDKKLEAGSIEEANKTLDEAGWKIGEDGIREKDKITKIEAKLAKSKTAPKKEVSRLEFSISTSDIPELKRAAEMIQEDLAKIGAKVELRVFETGALNQNVIQPRKYDALFFGQVINHESDLFAFWHSSQRSDPGLNIALYTNAKVDKLLESILVTLDKKERAKKYLEFQEEISKDVPAVFVYSPYFIYISQKNPKGLNINNLKGASDRFLGISNWYLKTDSIWKVFSASK